VNSSEVESSRRRTGGRARPAHATRRRMHAIEPQVKSQVTSRVEVSRVETSPVKSSIMPWPMPRGARVHGPPLPRDAQRVHGYTWRGQGTPEGPGYTGGGTPSPGWLWWAWGRGAAVGRASQQVADPLTSWLAAPVSKSESSRPTEWLGAAADDRGGRRGCVGEGAPPPPCARVCLHAMSSAVSVAALRHSCLIPQLPSSPSAERLPSS